MSLHDATIRDAVHAALLAANTMAGARVQVEQIDEQPDTELPSLTVMIDSAGQNLAASGSAPVFEVTADLLVLARVGGTKVSDTIAALDALVDQARSAVLCAPAVLQLCQMRSWRLGRSFKTDARLILAEGRLALSLQWREFIDPDASTLPRLDLVAIRQTDPKIAVDVNL